MCRQWHTWCFACVACGGVLQGEYMGRGGAPYCERDYQRLFGVRCAYCARYISGKVGPARSHEPSPMLRGELTVRVGVAGAAGGGEPPLPPDVRALLQVRGSLRRRRGDVPAGTHARSPPQGGDRRLCSGVDIVRCACVCAGRRHLAPALRAGAARGGRRRAHAQRHATRPRLLGTAGTPYILHASPSTRTYPYTRSVPLHIISLSVGPTIIHIFYKHFSSHKFYHRTHPSLTEHIFFFSPFHNSLFNSCLN